MGNSHPPNEGFDFYARTYPRVLERYGGDAATGRKLYHYFLEVDIPHPNLRLVQRAYTGGAEKSLALLTLEATADAIIAEKLASEDEVRLALESLASHTEDGSSVLGSPRIFQLWSRRSH